MRRRTWWLSVPGLLLALAPCSEAVAGWVGDRFFPSTFATVVPPSDDFLRSGVVVKPTTAASTREVDIPINYSKRITADWAVNFPELYRIVDPAHASTRSGFDNFVISTKYQLYTNAEHEFIFTIGGSGSIGGTGSRDVGANSFSIWTPTVFMGKGFGDLPESLAALRSFLVTATVGVSIPTKRSTILPTLTVPTEFFPVTLPTGLSALTLPNGATALTGGVNPNILQWAFALEYTLLTTIHPPGEPSSSRFVTGWVPLVELVLQTPLDGPLAGRTTGTVNPGLILVDRYFELGIGASIPINSSSGRDVGVYAQLHFFMSQIFPDTLGKPIFGN